VPRQVIVIAIDGIWEARYPEGEMFGKDRLHEIIRQHASATAKEIQSAVFESLRRFQNDARLEDDRTRRNMGSGLDLRRNMGSGLDL